MGDANMDATVTISDGETLIFILLINHKFCFADFQRFPSKGVDRGGGGALAPPPKFLQLSY